MAAAELFAPAPIDEVSVRSLPAFTVLETEKTGSLDLSWQRGFQNGALFAARAGSGLNTPTIVTFPDWEKAPTADGNQVHMLVQVMLDPLPRFPSVREPDAMLRDMPGMTVACYAQRGAYSPEALAAGLKQIMGYLKAKHIPQVGPPRYLYYATTSWMPSWWKVGEVEVPIAPGASG